MPRIKLFITILGLVALHTCLANPTPRTLEGDELNCPPECKTCEKSTGECLECDGLNR